MHHTLVFAKKDSSFCLFQEGETVDGNLKDLTTQVSELIHQIAASVRTFVPLQMQVVSRELYTAVEKRWPGMGFSILTAFLFLRVFCPAVIVPEPLLGIEIPQERKRALVLVSKALQAVANGTRNTTSMLLCCWVSRFNFLLKIM